jgi:hypothetical protein
MNGSSDNPSEWLCWELQARIETKGVDKLNEPVISTNFRCRAAK